MNAMLMSTVLLALAWFTAFNLAASAVSWLAGAALNQSGARPRAGALLAVRLFPACASLLLAFLMFVPAHWIAEPRDAQESFGWVVCAMAAAGAGLICRGIVRAAILERADRKLRSLERSSSSVAETREADGVPGIALAGLVRTRILMGRHVAPALTPAELEVAIAHEHAHGRALDNLKRWAIHCAPDFFGASAIARKVERDWHAAAESLADARAVGGDARRALDLASALVKVARLTILQPSSGWTPVWSPFNDPELLKARVLLLTSDVPAAPPFRPVRAAGAALLFVVATTLFVPILSGPIHYITEAAVALLP